MRRSAELVADALETLRAAGAKPSVRNGGKHIKISWVDRHGHRRLLIVPCTPSDWRTRANTRALLRRLLRRSASTENLHLPAKGRLS
jgi:hypothetical protein